MSICCNNVRHIPTLKHIRTMRSIPAGIGSSRPPALRAQDTEQRKRERERLAARRRIYERWQAFQRLPYVRWHRSR